MGAEREGRGDAAPKRKRNTDPGVGPDSDPAIDTFRTPPKSTVEDPRGPPAPAANAQNANAQNANAKTSTANAHDTPVEEDVEELGAADVVDFDALHAALGDLPPPPTSSSPTVGESQGRSSATYASARPHTIPPTIAPTDDLNAPTIIVASDSPDTVPTGAPMQMTVPMTQGVVVNAPYGSGPVRPPSQSSPGSDEYSTPLPFQAQAIPMPPDGSGNPNVTMHMPNRPRRPRSPTVVVVRQRGPTKQQKLLVFMAMLLLFVGAGIAILIYYPVVSPTAAPPPPRPNATSTGIPTAWPSAATTTTPTLSSSIATTPMLVVSSVAPTTNPPPSGCKPPWVRTK